MLLQRLREYAEERLSLPPPMYQEQPVRYLLELSADGRLLGVVDTADRSSRATERGVRRLAPHLKRSSGIRPKLLADTAVYALGMATDNAKPDRVEQQHARFVDLVRACAQETGEPTVRAVVTFLDSLPANPPTLQADFDPGATLTFRVDGVLPIDLPAVRHFWARVQGPDEEGDDPGAVMACIVCGLHRPVLDRHPIKIKGIPGGQTAGTDLISANAAAFESYGLKNSLIAPTCQECAEAYGNALNAILAGMESSLRVGGNLAFGFWTARPVDFSPVTLFSEPRPEDVRELLRAAASGQPGAAEIDETAFYAVALGASGARVAVRDWLDTTVGEVKRRVAAYFRLQELVQPAGDAWQPLSLRRLVNATIRDPQRESPPPLVGEALVGLALRGEPLPLDLLYLAIRRNRAEQGVTRERATLIKMVLNSQPTTGEGLTVEADLDLTQREPAYLCGRLLAVLDAVQRQALGNPNATIVDRFYGSASSAPASVFGTLLHGTQAHLARLRKDPRTEAAYRALDRRIEEVLAALGSFPRTLTLQQQGLFALGFYHQRAADRRAARERREARDQASPSGAAHDAEQQIDLLPPDEQV